MERQRPVSQVMRLSLDGLERALAQRTDNSQSYLCSAVFVDRDGTLNVECGYLHSPAGVSLLPTVGEALRLLNNLKVPVVVVTNQSALGRGLMELADFEAVNAALWKALQGTEAHYDALYYCPHVPDGDMPCACRKPQPGLLLQAAFDLDLDLRRSFMVGDKRSDLEAGRACGCHTVLVRTGWGDGAYQEMVSQGCEPDYVAATLLDASRWIVSQL